MTNIASVTIYPKLIIRLSLPNLMRMKYHKTYVWQFKTYNRGKGKANLREDKQLGLYSHVCVTYRPSHRRNHGSTDLQGLQALHSAQSPQVCSRIRLLEGCARFRKLKNFSSLPREIHGSIQSSPLDSIWRGFHITQEPSSHFQQRHRPVPVLTAVMWVFPRSLPPRPRRDPTELCLGNLTGRHEWPKLLCI